MLRGSLVHQDSGGHHGVVYPGLAQRMSAGTGILHSEQNDAYRADATRAQQDVRFVQMWVAPDGSDRTPGYEQREISDADLAGTLVPVASGRPGDDAAIRIGQQDAVLHAGRLAAGDTVTLPDAPFVHLFVAVGSVELEGVGSLAEGDAVRLTKAGARRLAADADGEVLVWEMHADLTG